MNSSQESNNSFFQIRCRTPYPTSCDMLKYLKGKSRSVRHLHQIDSYKLSAYIEHYFIHYLRDTMDWVDYKQIQNFEVGITPLFVDYLNDFEKLKDYYAADFRDRKSWKKLIDKVLSKQKGTVQPLFAF